MTWASELAQTLQEPTEMTRKWKATLSFLYILIWQFLEGPRNQDKCQEEASSVSSFNGSVSNTAASARGLVYVSESRVSATSHTDPKDCCCFCSQGRLQLRSRVPPLWAVETPESTTCITGLLLVTARTLCVCRACSPWPFAWCTGATFLPPLAKSAIFLFTVLCSLCQTQPLFLDLAVYGKMQKSYMD